MSAGDELPGAPCLVVFCLVESNLPEEGVGCTSPFFGPRPVGQGRGEGAGERIISGGETQEKREGADYVGN